MGGLGSMVERNVGGLTVSSSSSSSSVCDEGTPQGGIAVNVSYFVLESGDGLGNQHVLEMVTTQHLKPFTDGQHHHGVER